MMHALIGLYSWISSLSWIMKCFCSLCMNIVKDEKEERKFTFVDLNVVLSVDGGMRHYSCIAQIIA